MVFFRVIHVPGLLSLFVLVALVVPLQSASAAIATASDNSAMAPIAEVSSSATDHFVYANPSNARLASLKKGKSLSLVPITSQVTPRGLLLVSIDELANSADKAGIVNLTVISAVGDVSHLSVTVTRAARGNRLAEINGKPQSKPQTLKGVRIVSQGKDAAAPATGKPPIAKGAHCSTSLVKTYPHKKGRIGQIYADNSKLAKMSFKFSTGAKTNTGVGVSSTGAFGTFSSSGTTTSKSSFGVEYPTRSKSTHFETYLAMAQFKTTCTGPRPPMPSITLYEVKATGVAGGADWYKPKKNPKVKSLMNNCAPYRKGSKHIQKTGKAFTWKSGLQMKTLIGVNLSSQAGYTSKVQLRITMKKDGRICGVDKFIRDNPKRIIVKNP